MSNLVIFFLASVACHADRESAGGVRRFLAGQGSDATNTDEEAEDVMFDLFEDQPAPSQSRPPAARQSRSTTGTLQWANHPDKCLAVRSSFSGSFFGAPVVLETCNPRSQLQQFVVSTSGRGPIRFAGSPPGTSRMCIDVHAGENKNGNRIQLWECQPGNPAQQFFAPNGLSQTRISWTHGKCLDVHDHGNFVGNKLQLWECLDWNSDQVFNFAPASGGYIALGNRACPTRTDYFSALSAGAKPVSSVADCIRAAETLKPGGGCYGYSWSRIVRQTADPTFPSGCMIVGGWRGRCGLRYNSKGKGSGCPEQGCSVNVLCAKP